MQQAPTELLQSLTYQHHHHHHWNSFTQILIILIFTLLRSQVWKMSHRMLLVIFNDEFNYFVFFCLAHVTETRMYVCA